MSDRLLTQADPDPNLTPTSELRSLRYLHISCITLTNIPKLRCIVNVVRPWRALGFVLRPDDDFLKKALGCWPRRDDMLIVFEHMPGGSLARAYTRPLLGSR